MHTITISVSVLTAIFQVEPGLAGTGMSPFWILLELRMMVGPLCSHQSSDSTTLLNCLRSAAERFLFPVLKRGTNYRKKSPLQHLYLPSDVTSRHSYSGNHFRTLLLIDNLVDLAVT